MTDWIPLGDGPIPPERMEEELRIVRHDLKNTHHAADQFPTVVRDIADRMQRTVDGVIREATDAAKLAEARAATAGAVSARAEARADTLDIRLTALSNDVFGHPDRQGDRGILGEIDQKFLEVRLQLSKQSTQNWMILLALLGLIATIATAIFFKH